MPIIIDPDFSPPPPPETVTGIDGILSVTADIAHGGALLVADYTGDFVENIADIDVAGTFGGFALYTSGGAVATLSAGTSGPKLVDVTTAGGSAGVLWTLPTALPAGAVEVDFDWLSTAPFEGLQADRIRVALRNAGGTTLAAKDFPARGSNAAQAGWRWRTHTSEVVTGVYIYANGTVGAPQTLSISRVRAATWLPEAVRFRRADGTPVRSGYDALAPGGVAVAYDNEAPLSGPVSWYAEPIWLDGVVGAPSAPAAITLTQPPPSRLWLKSVSQPNLTVLARVATAEETGRTLRSSIVPTAGAQLSGGSSDVTLGWTGTVGLRTDTEAEYNALVEVLSSGVLLMQAPGCAGIPDQMYVLPQGELAARRMQGAETGQGWGFRIWPVSLVQVDRPTALGAPLMIPDLSWASTREDYATWLELRTAVPSWLSLLGGG